MGAAGSSGMDVQTNGAASPHTEHSAASQLNRAPHSRHGRLRRRPKCCSEDGLQNSIYFFNFEMERY